MLCKNICNYSDSASFDTFSARILFFPPFNTVSEKTVISNTESLYSITTYKKDKIDFVLSLIGTQIFDLRTIELGIIDPDWLTPIFQNG